MGPRVRFRFKSPTPCHTEVRLAGCWHVAVSNPIRLQFSTMGLTRGLVSESKNISLDQVLFKKINKHT